MDNFEALEKSIGYTFKDKSILKNALTHKSYANEKKIDSYERLEYLGDSILEFISSKYLYENYKNLSEGEMTKVRAYAVCEKSLYEIAKKHNFSDFLYLGKSEKSSRDSKSAILSDITEAIIAGIYLDSRDIQVVEKIVIENIKDRIEYGSNNVGVKDYKTMLQEKLQENGSVSIKYNVIKEQGPDHNKIFTVQVEVNGKSLADGRGRSKKRAEMEAARKAINILK